MFCQALTLSKTTLDKQSVQQYASVCRFEDQPDSAMRIFTQIFSGFSPSFFATASRDIIGFNWPLMRLLFLFFTNQCHTMQSPNTVCCQRSCCPVMLPRPEHWVPGTSGVFLKDCPHQRDGVCAMLWHNFGNALACFHTQNRFTMFLSSVQSLDNTGDVRRQVWGYHVTLARALHCPKLVKFKQKSRFFVSKS